ncbi:MAG: hypothetical protein ACRD5W_10245, partial [Candidatus Acidiferrales bacterium]
MRRPRIVATSSMALALAVTACATIATTAAPPRLQDAATPSTQASTAQPHIRNTQLATRAAGQNLDREFRAAVTAQQEPAWIGYAVPAISDRTSVCCGNWRDGNYTAGCCRMEQDHGMNIHTPDENEKRELSPVALEPALFVFYRAAERRVTNIRI